MDKANSLNNIAENIEIHSDEMVVNGADLKEKIMHGYAISMKEHLNELTTDNLELKEKAINEYFEFMKSLKNIPLPSISIKIDRTKVNEMLNKQEMVQQNQTINELNKKEEHNESHAIRKAYRFERKLKGGELPEIGAFVPQRTVLNLDLRHGDFLYAEPIESEEYYEGPKRYNYELAGRGNGENPRGLREFLKCRVEKMNELGKLYVSKTVNAEPVYKLDEIDHHLFLNEKDIREFGLLDTTYDYRKEEGCPIVDIAYYENDPQGTIRVVWNHATQAREESLIPSPIISNKKIKKQETESKVIEEDFKGKKILVIGAEPKKATYRDLVEKRGGEFTWASGNEGKSRLKSMIRKSDLVLMNLAHVSHRGTWKGIEYCKEHGIPHDEIDNFGSSSFVRTVSEMINENEQEDQIV